MSTSKQARVIAALLPGDVCRRTGLDEGAAPVLDADANNLLWVMKNDLASIFNRASGGNIFPMKDWQKFKKDIVKIDRAVRKT